MTIPYVHEDNYDTLDLDVTGSVKKRKIPDTTEYFIEKDIPLFLATASPYPETGIDITDYFKQSIGLKKSELEVSIQKYKEGTVGLPDNWDGNGAKALTKETWDRAFNLLWKLTRRLENHSKKLPLPQILPNLDGSFDLNWEYSQFTLLLNVPADSSEFIQLYGEDLKDPKNNIEIRASYSLIVDFLQKWLVRIL